MPPVHGKGRDAEFSKRAEGPTACRDFEFANLPYTLHVCTDESQDVPKFTHNWFGTQDLAGRLVSEGFILVVRTFFSPCQAEEKLPASS